MVDRTWYLKTEILDISNPQYRNIVSILAILAISMSNYRVYIVWYASKFDILLLIYNYRPVLETSILIFDNGEVLSSLANIRQQLLATFI